jgi:hypothetical protein
MSRSVVAFLVAPLWVPLLVTPFCYPFVFPHAAQLHWVVIGAILSTIFSYGGTILLGVPIFSILRALNLTASWIAIAVGFVIGAVTFEVFSVLFGLSLNGGNLELVMKTYYETFHDPIQLMFLVLPGSLGGIVGITLWLIARPDRRGKVAV